MNAGTLKLLLHMYCHPPEVPFPYEANPAFIRECRGFLLCCGLIDREDEFGVITEKGRIHVQALLVAPLPECKWTSPLLKNWPTMADVTGISDIMRGGVEAAPRPWPEAPKP